MDTETIVVESIDESDLGSVQEAFRDYPQKKAGFERKREEYRDLVHTLKSTDLGRITGQDMTKADALYEELCNLRQECLDMRALLARKADDLILEAQKLEKDLGLLSPTVINKDHIQGGISLLRQSMELRSIGYIHEALERALHAVKCLAGLIAMAKSAWIGHHEEYIHRFDDPEI